MPDEFFICPICDREYKTYIRPKCIGIRDITNIYLGDIDEIKLHIMDEVK